MPPGGGVAIAGSRDPRLPVPTGISRGRPAEAATRVDGLTDRVHGRRSHKRMSTMPTTRLFGLAEST